MSFPDPCTGYLGQCRCLYDQLHCLHSSGQLRRERQILVSWLTPSGCTLLDTPIQLHPVRVCQPEGPQEPAVPRPSLLLEVHVSNTLIGSTSSCAPV